MHVPIGVSGVHAVPNTLHSHGLIAPLSTSPHWQAFGSATRTPGTSKRSSASHLANSGSQLESTLGDEAQAAPLELRPDLEDLVQYGKRPRIAVLAHTTRVLVLDTTATLADLGQEHGDRLQDVEGLEAGGDKGLAVLLGNEAVRALARRPSTRDRAR